MDVSICLILQGDTYILQQREDNPAKGAAGLVGAFGGKIERGESPVEAVCRELSEETSLKPSTEDFEYIGEVTVVADKDHQPVQIRAKVFRLHVPYGQAIEAQEGRLVRHTLTEVRASTTLTPATQAAFEQYIGE